MHQVSRPVDLDRVVGGVRLHVGHDRTEGRIIVPALPAHAAVQLGALASEQVDDEQLAALGQYADSIGLAFQVQDDILDIESDTSVLGKQQGADVARDKPTYPALLGLDGAHRLADQLRDQALGALTGFGPAAQRLRPIVMTGFTTVFSSLPLVLATGAGSESRMVIGMVIFAGVIVSAFMTLFIVPTAYAAFARNTGSPEAREKALTEQDAASPYRKGELE